MEFLYRNNRSVWKLNNIDGSAVMADGASISFTYTYLLGNLTSTKYYKVMKSKKSVENEHFNWHATSWGDRLGTRACLSICDSSKRTSCCLTPSRIRLMRSISAWRFRCWNLFLWFCLIFGAFPEAGSWAINPWDASRLDPWFQELHHPQCNGHGSWAHAMWHHQWCLPSCRAQRLRGLAYHIWSIYVYIVYTMEMINDDNCLSYLKPRQKLTRQEPGVAGKGLELGQVQRHCISRWAPFTLE